MNRKWQGKKHGFSHSKHTNAGLKNEAAAAAAHFCLDLWTVPYGWWSIRQRFISPWLEHVQDLLFPQIFEPED